MLAMISMIEALPVRSPMIPDKMRIEPMRTRSKPDCKPMMSSVKRRSRPEIMKSWGRVINVSILGIL